MSLLRVRGLKKYFGGSGWPRRKPPLKAVDGVDLDLAAGHTLALVGESGCGKSTLARAILRLHEPTEGEVWLDGTPVTGIGRAALRARRREMQIIFQDPYASLNPRRSVGQTLDEPLSVHRWGNRATRQARVNELLEVVGLRPAMANRYPHEFSGGQRQRIGIARALALSPKLIVADEAVSAQFVLIGWSAVEIYRLAWADAGVKAAELAHAPCDASAVSDALEAEAADFATLAPSAPLAPAPKVAVENVRAADVGFKPVRSPLAKDGELTHATKSEKRLGKGKKAGGAPVGAADSKGRL